MYPNRPLESVAFVGQIEQVDQIRRTYTRRQERSDTYRLQQLTRSPGGCVGYVPQIWGDGSRMRYDKLGNEMVSNGIGYKSGETPGSGDDKGGFERKRNINVSKDMADLQLAKLDTNNEVNMDTIKTGKRALMKSTGVTGLPMMRAYLERMGNMGQSVPLVLSRLATSRFSGLADFQMGASPIDVDFGNIGSEIATDLGLDGTDAGKASAKQFSTAANPPSDVGSSPNIWRTESASTHSPGFASFMVQSESSRNSPPIMFLSGLNGSVDSYGSSALQAFLSSPWGVSRLSIWMAPQNTASKSNWDRTA